MRQPAAGRCATAVTTRPRLAGRARGIAAPANTCPVRWAGRRAVVTIPERMDVSNAGQIRDELLSVINRGARVLIADMTATASCDHAGAGAVAWAYQRGVTGGTELRLVVTAQIVSRVLSISGVDRLVCIYPSLKRPPPPSHPRRRLPRWPLRPGREPMASRRLIPPGRQVARPRRPGQRTATGQAAPRP
jgi:anti-sigma B factor antagonist